MATTVERLGAITNLVHGFIYFSKEAAEEYASVGLQGRQQYFASRAAAMGPVGPEMVTATFYNFNPEIIYNALPSAWAVADAAAVQQARLRGAARVLDPIEPDLDHQSLSEAIDLAQAMVDGVGDEGKPLAAANRAVELPDEPMLRLWQLVTIIREWRGDAHVAALSTAPVSGLQALILHAATGQVPASVLQTTRAWSDDAWRAGIDTLVERDLVETDGAFTPAGRAFREDIETTTNRAAQPLVDAIGDDATVRLCELLKPLRNGLIGSGIFNQSLGGSRS